jgi:hypothetical protein
MGFLGLSGGRVSPAPRQALKKGPEDRDQPALPWRAVAQEAHGEGRTRKGPVVGAKNDRNSHPARAFVESPEGLSPLAIRFSVGLGCVL